MSGHEPDSHGYWEEQAAGYALDALEPEEVVEFARHLAGCDECQKLVDQHALVAAQLGALAYDDRPAPTWSELRAGIVGPHDEPSSDVVPLRRRRSAVLLSAAAASVAAVVGITVWQTSSGSSEDPLTSAHACADTAGCHVVALRADGKTSLSVLVFGHDVALRSAVIAQPPAGSEWALWRLPKSGPAQLMTTFDNANGTRATLGLPYADIAGFALSREPAGTTPTTPSVVVATGTSA